jgi:hypothetical protein
MGARVNASGAGPDQAHGLVIDDTADAVSDKCPVDNVTDVSTASLAESPRTRCMKPGLHCLFRRRARIAQNNFLLRGRRDTG